MRRTFSLILLTAASVILAACSAPEALKAVDEVHVPAISGDLTAAALPGWTSDEELTVEVLGTGLGNSNSATTTATLVIPDPGSVHMVFAQVVTKAGSSGEGDYPDPTQVVILARDATDAVLDTKSLTGGGVERVAIQSTTGASGTTGYSHEASFMGAVAAIEVDISDDAVMEFPNSPRALIVSVFRDLGAASSSAGVLPNLYVFGNDGYPTAEQTIALPADFAGGDIAVTFAISDVELVSRSSGFTDNDPRIVHYSASAGGVSASATLDEPNMGADLAIVELLLSDVPAGTTEVVAELYSPHKNDESPEGDSVYWNTLNVTVEVSGDELEPEGCTPGYWRQEHHFDSWTDHSPSDLFSSVFDRVITVRTGGRSTKADPTLLQAVWAKGGEVNALARHATAAILNAASADVDYQYSHAEIVTMVQDAIDSGDFETAKNALANANEAGCDLN